MLYLDAMHLEQHYALHVNALYEIQRVHVGIRVRSILDGLTAAARNAALATTAVIASFRGPEAARLPRPMPGSHELMGCVGICDEGSSCAALAAASPLSLVRRRFATLSSGASPSAAP